eukprot:jgi/Ulvmu1/4247/UM192_0007.1
MTSPKLMKALARSSRGSGYGVAWVVPLLVLAVIVVVFVKAFSNVMFSQSPRVSQDTSTSVYQGPVFAAQMATEDQSAVEVRQRMQMPFYVQCFQSPSFTSGPLSGACDVLHMPRTNNLVYPTPLFRTQPTVNIDVSSCGFYLNSTAVGEEADGQQGNVADLMQPFEVQLRPNSTDHDVFLQVYCGGDFGFLPRLAPYLPAGPISVLDAGTNVGLAAILFAQLIKFRGEVVAVDANPQTLQVMRQNTEFLGAAVTPVEAAIVSETVAANTSTLTFAGHSDQYWGFRVDHHNWQHPKRVAYEVQTRSLRTLKAQARAGRFDLIKLDIEGEEVHILPDAASRAVLCEARCIFMELHDRFEPGCTAAFHDFLQAGCGGGAEDFEHITTSGEYMLYCKPSAHQGSR